MKSKKWPLVAAVFIFLISGLIAYQATRIPHEFHHDGFASPTEITKAQAEFQRDYQMFQEAVEESLAWRASALNEIGRLKAKVQNGSPLTTKDLRYLHEGGEIYIGLRTELLRLAHKHKNFVDSGINVRLTPNQGTRLLKASNNSEQVIGVQVDPNDQLGNLLIKQFKLSLASALVLYDNFLIAIWPYQEASRLRSLINYDNTTFLNGLKEITNNYLDSAYRAKVQVATQYYRTETEWRKQNPSPIDQEHEYLDLLISGSPTYEVASTKNWVDTKSQKITHWVNQYKDALLVFRDETLNVVSGLFGNAVGLIETRKGKLLELGEVALQGIQAQLKPLDILLEKTPFRLTDKLIPGHFGHVAIWLGTEKDLRARGLWNDPRLKPYQEDIKRGHSVLEALRSGVQISRLDHFLNVDDLAVIRVKDLPSAKHKQYLSVALDQIGKEYDFNFDVETDKRIVCSELAYVVFQELSWPLEKTAGRYTISPDNVAHLAIKDRNQFEVPLLYHDGHLINQSQSAALQSLIAGDYQRVQRMVSSQGN